MRKLIVLLITMVAGFALSACGSLSSKPPEDFLKQQVQTKLRYAKDLNNVELGDITIIGFTDQGSYKCDKPGARIARVRATVRGQDQPISLLIVHWKDDKAYHGNNMPEDYLTRSSKW